MRKVVDKTGKRFGRLVVLSTRYCDIRKCGLHNCKCDCGNIKDVHNGVLGKRVNSCGCLRKDVARQKAIENVRALENIIDGNGGTIPRLFNQKIRSDNSSGVKGVSMNTRKDRWVARIKYKKKTYELGTFKEKQDAINARLEAEKKYFGAHSKGRNNMNNIKKLRTELGFTQVKLGKMVGVDNVTISSYETGKKIVPDEMYGKLATALLTNKRYLKGESTARYLSAVVEKEKGEKPLTVPVTTQTIERTYSYTYEETIVYTLIKLTNNLRHEPNIELADVIQNLTNTYINMKEKGLYGDHELKRNDYNE